MTRETVLVTGGAGFIGSHVCKALSLSGFLPVTYDTLTSGNAEAVKWGPLEQGDIRDRTRLKEALLRHRPVAILHFAALIKVGDSVQNPAAYYENNVLGSYELLEAARAANVRHMVFSSTAAVYGIPQTPLITESHPTHPINPYGHTKLAMENMIRDYASAYPLSCAILRYFNAAGADADGELGSAYKADSHLVPLIMQAATGMIPELQIFGDDYPTPDGTALRDYIHVSDLASAHVLALRHIMMGKGNVTLNLGTNQSVSVKQMLEKARKITGAPITAAIKARRAGDPPVLVADASEARRVLDWTPLHSDMDTILRTAWLWRCRQNRLGRTGAFLPEQQAMEA